MVLFKLRVEIDNLNIRSFTFHYGSIQIVAGLIIAYITCKFTFHYGSIQIEPGLRVDERSPVFTFHYGSIQIQLLKPRKLTKTDLHSTMVLFKWLFYFMKPSDMSIYIPLWFYSN